MDYENDAQTTEKTTGDELPVKINAVNAAGLGVGIGIVITIVWGVVLALLPNYLPLSLGLKVLRLCGALIALASFIWLEVKTTGDFLGFFLYCKAKQKTFTQTIFNFFKLLFFLYIASTFLFAPWLPENFRLWNSRQADVLPTGATTETTEPHGPTVTDRQNVAVETIVIPTPTYTSTPNPTNTPTPNPTSTPEPTPTSTLYKYRIGVFEQNPTNCTKKDEKGEVIVDLDRNDEIIAGLISLGFNATEVAVTSTNNYDGFNVLYMPYGWSCSYLDYDKESIRNFLDRKGTGLLIGDPRPNSVFTFYLFPAELYFSPLTEEEVREQSNPTFINTKIRQDFERKIFLYTEIYEYPIAESLLTIEQADGFYYNRVLTHVSPWRPSFIVSAEESPRFVIMPGSEYPVSEYAIPGELMKNIILWLAHAPVN